MQSFDPPCNDRDRNFAGEYPVRKRYVNSIEVTCHQMIGGDFFLCRLDRRALWHGEGTAGMKAATRERVDGRRDFSGQNISSRLMSGCAGSAAEKSALV